MVVNDKEIFLKKKEANSVSMVVNNIDIFQKMKNKGQLSIEKIFLECKRVDKDQLILLLNIKDRCIKFEKMKIFL